MQCSQCNYIQFKSSSKCQICGFDSKNSKPKDHALEESGDVFTVFVPAAAPREEPASGTAAASSEFMESAATPEKTDAVDAEMGAADDHDPAMELLENHPGNSEDFELDLSGMNDSDSEDWIMGATDHPDVSNVEPQAKLIRDENLLPESPVAEGDGGQKAGFELNDPSMNESKCDPDVEKEDFLKESGELILETELDSGKPGAEAGRDPAPADISEASETSTDLDSSEKFEDLRLEMEKENQEDSRHRKNPYQKVPDLQAFFEDRGPDADDDENNPPSPAKNPNPGH